MISCYSWGNKGEKKENIEMIKVRKISVISYVTLGEINGGKKGKQ